MTLKLQIIIMVNIMVKKPPPITPGDILLEEFLKPVEISQAQLARDINVPPNRINQIINGKREITADTALRLSKYFSIEPEFWLNLQMRFNMKMAQEKAGKEIEKNVKKYISPTNPISPNSA